jgi:hypothetical protein
MPFCPKCGAQYIEGSEFCTNCGSSLRVQVAAVPKPSPAQQVRPSHIKRNIIAIIILVLIIGIAASSIMRTPEAPTSQSEINTLRSQTLAGPHIVILDYNVTVKYVRLDTFELDTVSLSLKNEGDTEASITELVVASNDQNITSDILTSPLGAGESQQITHSFYLRELPKKIGADNLEITMMVLGHPKATGTETFASRVLAEKKVSIPIQKLRLGDTVQEINPDQNHNLSLTILWWKESNIAVWGTYGGEYYTFTAKPGMKFVILAFQFKNNWIREQDTPYLSSGEISTDKGYIYPIWTPPSGVSSTEYNPRPATPQEIKDLIGDAGAFEHLLQEQSVDGCVVFEVPQDATPVEATVAYLPAIIVYTS